MRRRLRIGRGLFRIELYEHVSEQAGRRLSAPLRRRAIARARRRVAPLKRWERIPEASFKRFAAGGSAVRVSRLLELVPAGARILDIGVGHGYVAGVLLRDARPSHYGGIDLHEGFAESTRQMLAANDLEDRGVEIIVSDLFDLDPEFWRAQSPDVVLMLEMLEHVEDPGAALRAIVAATGPATKIIFTVPLKGRLDGVWGHRSRFDRRRLQRLCRAAGIEIEHAEPVHGTWSLVAGRAGTPAPVDASSGPEPGYTFVRCRVPEAGVDGITRLPMPRPALVRLELSVDRPDEPGRLVIRGLDQGGGNRLSWSGDVRSAGLGKPTTFVLRPGRKAGALAPGPGRDPGQVAWMEVALDSESGVRPVPTVHRAAFVAG